MKRKRKTTPASIQHRSDRLVAAMRDGQHWRELGGRPLKYAPELIVFRLGLDWRLLWRPASGKGTLLSHAQYDRVIALKHMRQTARQALS